MSWLGFKTGYSFFDVWSLVHLAFWVFIGSCLWGLRINKWAALASCFVVSLVWELFEHFVAFRSWPDHWLDPESWWNSFLSDPLTCVVGVLGIWWLLDHRPRRVP
jgi:hypothetical protein